MLGPLARHIIKRHRAGFSAALTSGGNGNERCAANLVAFQKEIARCDLSLTHTIVQPTQRQGARGRAAPGGRVALPMLRTPAPGTWCAAPSSLATLATPSLTAVSLTGRPAGTRHPTRTRSRSRFVPLPGLKFLCPRHSYIVAGKRFVLIRSRAASDD